MPLPTWRQRIFRKKWSVFRKQKKHFLLKSIIATKTAVLFSRNTGTSPHSFFLVMMISLILCKRCVSQPCSQSNSICAVLSPWSRSREKQLGAFKMLKVDVSAKDDEALISLWSCFRDGIGVERNCNIAAVCYKCSADQHVVDRLRIGDYISKGIGLKRSSEIAGC